MPPVAAPAAPPPSVQESRNSGDSVPAGPDTPSIASILHGLKKRGLSICLNPESDGLRLSGPQEARTEKVKATLKAAKPALIAYLRDQEQQRQRDQARADAEDCAALESEFGKELVELGFTNEVDLLRQNEETTDSDPDQCAALAFSLPEIIHHPDPAAFWREWKSVRPETR